MDVWKYFLAGSVILVILLLLTLKWVGPTEVLVLGSAVMTYMSGLHVALSDLIIPVAVGVLIVERLKRPEAKKPSFVQPVLAWSFGILVVATVSLMLGSNASSFSTRVGVVEFFKLIVVCLYLVVSLLLFERVGLSRTLGALRVWVWFAALVGYGSVLTQFAGVPIIPAGSARSFGFFQDPNIYAGYLLLSLTLVFLLESFDSSPHALLWIAGLAGGVFATGSRAGLGTLILIMCVGTLVTQSRRVRRAMLLLGIGGAWVLFGIYTGNTRLLVFSSLQRLAESSGETSNDPRFALWGRAIELWLDNPFFGIGWGQYVTRSGDVYGISSRTGQGFVTHNTFLSVLSESGVAGAFLVLVGISFVLAQLMRSSLKWESRLSLGLGFGVILVQMLSLNLQNIRYVWVYIGLALALSLGSADRGALRREKLASR